MVRFDDCAFLRNVVRGAKVVADLKATMAINHERIFYPVGNVNHECIYFFSIFSWSTSANAERDL